MNIEFYIISARRCNGEIPSLTKTIEERIYFNKEEAFNKSLLLNDKYKGEIFKVFICQGSVIREV